MAKSQGALVLITVFIGALFFLSGLVFTLQGLGIVGPTSSFMFKSQTWIDNGVGVLVLGIVLLAIGLFLRSRSAKSSAKIQQQYPADDQQTKPSA